LKDSMDDLKANVTSQFEGKYKKIDLTGALEEIEDLVSLVRRLAA